MAPGACWKERSAWGAENPSTSTRTPSTLTLVGERLEDDESPFEAEVFKGPADSLGALLEGAPEPLDAILWGLAEPLEAVLRGSAESLHVSEEHLADFPEVDTDPEPPEERTLDSVVLCGRSEKNNNKKTQQQQVKHV